MVNLQVIIVLTLLTACPTRADNGKITLTLGKESKTVTKKDRERLDFLDPDLTILKTDKLPEAKKLMPSIGNGYLATVVHSDTIYRSDMFNGYNLTSHRARIQSTCAVNITSISRSSNSTEYWLDIGRGMYIEMYKGDTYNIEMDMYAHRKYSGLLVTEINVLNNDVHEDLKLTLDVNSGDPSSDLHVKQQTTSPEIRTFSGQTTEAEYEKFGKQDVIIRSTIVPNELVIKPLSSASYMYLTAISDNLQNATKFFKEGKEAYFNQTLESSHVLAWFDIWRNGRIDIIGNMELTRLTYSTLYYILSSIPDSLQVQKAFVGLSPGGLANGAQGKDYYGHVFWDQETWMFPPVLMLQSSLGKALIKTRIRTLDSAKEYASSRGYEGAMYTWESAYSGLDVCPAYRYSHYEQHITGDIALAFQQYLHMTNDWNFLIKERGAEAIQNIAMFWASRVSYNNDTKMYEIKGVMPPDEYHYNVNNSAYTNAVAKKSLQMVKEFATPNDKRTSLVFEDIANKMYIPFNKSGNWHYEFDGYTEGETVKQADVILMGYPLMYNMTAEVRKNDLNVYEKVTPGGPAMTWSMFAVGWLEIENIEKANKVFLKQLMNNAGPFNVWTENADGEGAVNFITGMGGYLQSVIFGYGGFRIFPDYLQFNCNLPPKANRFNIYGIDYLGGSIDFYFSEAKMVIKQTTQASVHLKLVTVNGDSHNLNVGQEMTLKRQKASITAGYVMSTSLMSTSVMSTSAHDTNICVRISFGAINWMILFAIWLFRYSVL